MDWMWFVLGVAIFIAFAFLDAIFRDDQDDWWV